MSRPTLTEVALRLASASTQAELDEAWRLYGSQPASQAMQLALVHIRAERRSAITLGDACAYVSSYRLTFMPGWERWPEEPSAP